MQFKRLRTCLCPGSSIVDARTQTDPEVQDKYLDKVPDKYLDKQDMYVPVFLHRTISCNTDMDGASISNSKSKRLIHYISIPTSPSREMDGNTDQITRAAQCAVNLSRAMLSVSGSH